MRREVLDVKGRIQRSCLRTYGLRMRMAKMRQPKATRQNQRMKVCSIDDASTGITRATQEQGNRSMGKGEPKCGKRKKALRLVLVMRDSATGLTSGCRSWRKTPGIIGYRRHQGPTTAGGSRSQRKDFNLSSSSLYEGKHVKPL